MNQKREENKMKLVVTLLQRQFFEINWEKEKQFVNQKKLEIQLLEKARNDFEEILCFQFNKKYKLEEFV